VKHKSWHDYRVVKPHSFPIFAEEWDADEELLLIEGAEKMGMGNWQAIADYVGTKNKEECERHYLDVYVNSPYWPLPDMNIEFNMTEEDYTIRKRQRLHAMSGRSPAPPARSQKPITSGPTFHEIQGYMPRRYEFETEQENEAEQFVKDMVFTEDDTQEEIDLKLMVLDIYNSRLDKRIEKKRFILERGLLDYKKNQTADKKRTREERELYNRTRVFARLQTSEDYEMFVDGLLKEQRCRDRIVQLQEWRENGITTIKAGEQYERDKVQRTTNLKALIQREAMLTNERNHARNTLKAQIAMQQNRESSPTSRASTPKPSSASQTATGRKPANPLNIKEAEGVHLLSEDEQQLCSALRILPRPYLVIKDTILKEYAKHGFLRRRQARELIKIDVNKTSRIYDFFVENGWIKAFKSADNASNQPTASITVS
jgi:transcriptional adapter 2-alpha